MAYRKHLSAGHYDDHTPELGRHRLLLIFALTSSFGWFIVAVFTGKPEHAHRGGQIGVALSFAALFLNRPYGAMIQRLLGEPLQEIERLRALMNEHSNQQVSHRLDRLQNRIEGLEARLDADSSGQHRQNLYLAWAAFISTLMAGFGDWLASWILTRFPNLIASFLVGSIGSSEII